MSADILSRQDYLGGVDDGFLIFPSWDLKEVEVRVYGDAATLMHRSTIEVVLGGMTLPESVLWHIVMYERRNGDWQAVWSLATEVRPMPTPASAGPPHAPDIAVAPRNSTPWNEVVARAY